MEYVNKLINTWDIEKLQSEICTVECIIDDYKSNLCYALLLPHEREKILWKIQEEKKKLKNMYKAYNKMLSNKQL